MRLKFVPISSEKVRDLQNGGLDFYGNLPIKLISDGGGIPCRHCLEDIAEGDGYLALAFGPFADQHAYAEVGPIFIHSKKCHAYSGKVIPTSFLTREHYIMHAYSKRTKAIIYGSGKRITSDKVALEAHKLFENMDTDFIHLRSASYTCFSCRVERDEE